MSKKVLVLGGTGAMGVYLVPLLAKMGFKVDVVALDGGQSENPNIKFMKAKNAKEPAYIGELLKNDYDGIVDFLIYGTKEFKEKYRPLLENTGHYIYLSTYRVYANEEHPIKETSPRLLDVMKEEPFISSEDYSLYKARGEDVLKASGLDNWTTIRPAITYSKRRFQLVTLEADVVIERARHGKTVLLPRQAMDVQATMSWAGDVAKMISRLLFNNAAKRETYTVATAEHNPWRVVADYYKELIGLKYKEVDKEDYISFISPDKNSPYARWQLEYDRMFDRIIDNSKILNIAGMKQSELMPLREGLKRELAVLPADTFTAQSNTSRNMDIFLEKR
ncbi:MAG: NAD dependent epimerase/dehydratase family protein [Firmicutes bacterium ADurb.Bin099]|nr:MAG: NAD dependent epimerase/dehydratase family protein [Firmicutes bacterium ADurb.Bin099]